MTEAEVTGGQEGQDEGYRMYSSESRYLLTAQTRPNSRHYDIYVDVEAEKTTVLYLQPVLNPESYDGTTEMIANTWQAASPPP